MLSDAGFLSCAQASGVTNPSGSTPGLLLRRPLDKRFPHCRSYALIAWKEAVVRMRNMTQTRAAPGYAAQGWAGRDTTKTTSTTTSSNKEHQLV